MGFKIIQGILNVFLHCAFRYKIIGRENFPKVGGAIVAVNHRSYWDVIFAGVTSKRPLRYMAKSGLFKNPIFGRLITKLGAFPVQRGKGDIGAIKSALAILKSGNLMLIFPEGRRVLDGSHTTAKSGVALIALKAQVPVIPVCISGKYGFMKKITVSVGKPMNFEEYYDKKVDAGKLQEISDDILNAVYALEEKYD